MENLTVGYRNNHRETPLLTGLNERLSSGELVALLGENGAGKSTLLRTITCDLDSLAGRVLFDGRDVTQLSLRQCARLLGLVSTDRLQAGGLTVRELVALGRQPHTGFLGRLGVQDREVVEQAMKSVGIAHKADVFVAQMSDGERQKAMIARALAQQTPIVVLDEPTAFLDVASRIETMRLLVKLAHDQGKAVLLSSHDVSQSLLMADRLWLITHDRCFESGTPQQLIADGAMNRLFADRDVSFDSSLLDYR